MTGSMIGTMTGSMGDLWITRTSEYFTAGTLSIISTVGDTLALFVAHWYLLLNIISTVPP